MNMKNLVFGAAAAAGAILTGCNDDVAPRVPTEAETFGYVGSDIAETSNDNYIVSAPGVTNWVPSRLLAVFEKYELTADEKALLDAAGVLMPCAPLSAIPEGYSTTVQEPWFAYLTKPTESFGFTGVSGILVHYDDDKNVFETGESYFSSYWATREEANVALAKIKAEMAAKYGVKKFHALDIGWVAEYVRLGVMGVVGQKDDGRWSCMIDFRDKCNSGCGAWDPVDVQQDRRDRHEHARALKAWSDAVNAAIAKNGELVAGAMKERGLPGFPEAQVSGTLPDGRAVRSLGGSAAAAKDAESLEETVRSIWNEQSAAVETALGIKLDESMVVKYVDPEGHGARWSANAEGDLFEVFIGVVVPVAAEPGAAGEGDEEQPEANWQIAFAEKLQPSVEIPAKPQMKKKAE